MQRPPPCRTVPVHGSGQVGASRRQPAEWSASAAAKFACNGCAGGTRAATWRSGCPQTLARRCAGATRAGFGSGRAARSGPARTGSPCPGSACRPCTGSRSRPGPGSRSRASRSSGSATAPSRPRRKPQVSVGGSPIGPPPTREGHQHRDRHQHGRVEANRETADRVDKNPPDTQGMPAGFSRPQNQ